MERTSLVYQTYVEILRRELVCAMGCTEPIAIAYCAARARQALGQLPTRVELAASGNIIKNVKSVIVPNTGGLRGLAAAAGIGILAGDADAELQVLANVTPEQIAQLPAFLEKTDFAISAAESDYLLDIEITVRRDEHFATVRAVREHTNIILIETDQGVVFSKDPEEAGSEETAAPDYSLLSVEGICDFADTCALSDVQALLDRQLSCNCAIAEEGLRGSYGASIGKVLLSAFGGDVHTRARAYAAAASDARMNGCDMPVVINSGSGNQGITASLPVYIYAKELGVSQEKLYRALLVSNLVTLHEKTGIGRLSAYCGAVSAGAGAGAGITYLYGGGCREISHTIVNALAITSGIVCDGAKSSCAAKIAMAVEAGILGFEMFRVGQQFYGGDGLVAKGVENSIANFSRLGRVGMRETDREIIRMMTEA